MTTSFAFDQLSPVAPAAPAGTPGAGPSPAEIAQAVEAARAEGFAAGHAAGANEAAAALAPAVEALGAAAHALDAERAAVADAVERASVELALRIAEQVVGAAVAARPEAVVDAVRGALRRLVERERLIVLVNPADLDVVREALAAVVAEQGGVEHYEVQAERRVARGGAVLHTADGDIDASLETKLQRAREVLEDELAGRDG